MVFVFKKSFVKGKTRIRVGYECFGCGNKFRTRKLMQSHQGDAWPSCPNSVDKLFDNDF